MEKIALELFISYFGTLQAHELFRIQQRFGPQNQIVEGQISQLYSYNILAIARVLVFTFFLLPLITIS